MVTKYPAAIDTVFTLKPVLDGQPVTGGSVEQLREAIIAIEDELGVKPSGVYATVRNRLDVIEGVVGNLRIIELEGDLGGTLETPHVIGIQGRPISDVEPSEGQTLIWDGIAWVPGAIPADVNFAGDLTGNPLLQTVVGLQNRPLSATAPTVGQGIVWGGSSWAPGTVGGSLGGDVTGPTETNTVVGINETPVTTSESSSNGDALTLQIVPLDETRFNSPQSITTDGDFLWVGNFHTRNIDKVNITTKETVHIDLTSFMPGDSTNIFSRKILVDTNLSPYLFVVCMDAFRVLVIDRFTNKVIGIGDTNGSRARSLTLDNLGNVWVGTHSGTKYIQRFIIANLISNFPNPILEASHVGISDDPEEITFDGTYIWAVTSEGDLNQIDPTNDGNWLGTFNNDGSWFADVVSAYGSIWVLNQSSSSVEKYNPNTFPSAPVDTVTLNTPNYLRAMKASNGFLWVPDTLSGDGTLLYKIATSPLSQVATFVPPGDEQAYFELVPDPSLNRIYIVVSEATDPDNLGVRTFNTSSNAFITNYNKSSVVETRNIHYAPPLLPGHDEMVLETVDVSWSGSAGICFDGRYLWVTDGDSAGSNNTFDPRTRFVRVIDGTTIPPTPVANIDLSPFAPFMNVRTVTMSSDQTKMYICIKGWPGLNNITNTTASINKSASGKVSVTAFNLAGDDPPRLSPYVGAYVTITGAADANNNGTFKIVNVPSSFTNTWTIDNPYAPTGADANNGSIHVTINTTAGRVIIVDKNTFKIVGNAEMKTGPIGDEDGSRATGARHAIDIGTGILYVNNSNQSIGNIIEKFDLNVVLNNGSKPTKSFGYINTPDHSEELSFAYGYIWTAGWAYTTTLQRIDPVSEVITTWTDPDYFVSGGFPAFGSIWCGSFEDVILRFDPNTFPSAPIIIPTDPGRTMGFIRGGFTTDGTYVWVPDVSGQGGTGFADQAKVDPNTNTVKAYVRISVPGDIESSGGLQEMTFDGTYIWGTRRFNEFSGATEIRASSIVKIDPRDGFESQVLVWTGKKGALVWEANQAIGDLEGYQSGSKVVGLQGRPITTIAPQSGQGLVWDGAYWKPGTVGGSLGGDVTGPTGTNTVVQITGAGGNVDILASTQTSIANAEYQPFSEQATFVATGAFDTIYGNYLVPASTGVQIDVVVTGIDAATNNFASWKLSFGALRTGAGSAVTVGTVPAPTGIAPDRFTAGAGAWIATVVLSGNTVIVKAQATSGIRWGVSFQAFPVTP